MRLTGTLPLGPYKGELLQRPTRTPSCKGQRTDARWVMA